MSEVTGSKRPASTPFASPSKAASKRSRTRYDYGDDDDTDSSPEDQWSAEDADSVLWDSEDDDLVNCMPSPSADFMSISSDDDGGDTLASNTANPPPKSSTSCRCDATNAVKVPCTNCTCSEWGYACNTEICGCHGGPACHNPFNGIDVPSLFGSDPITLHECFIAWVLKQKGMQTEQINIKALFELAVRSSHLITEITEYDDPYLEWRTKWDALSKPEQEVEVGLRQEMNRMAFTKNDSSMTVFFSLCRQPGHWESANETWHCKTCGECMNWREWHCEQRDKYTGGSLL
ncbi:hypothetical protein N0V82_002188 [Gnomoniopsis sp. IMI 355080]|nr:hypothetical protein N0V82_002188 [Gnomoniopsis sp. IMI 355080]